MLPIPIGLMRILHREGSEPTKRVPHKREGSIGLWEGVKAWRQNSWVQERIPKGVVSSRGLGHVSGVNCGLRKL